MGSQAFYYKLDTGNPVSEFFPGNIQLEQNSDSPLKCNEFSLVVPSRITPNVLPRPVPLTGLTFTVLDAVQTHIQQKRKTKAQRDRKIEVSSTQMPFPILESL